jgi:3-methyladenine DNA glycosylase/8-oxoguanine DNA glycosylase
VAVPQDAAPDELLVGLMSAEGVDDCTLHYVAMLALNDSDAFPAGDPELQRALGPDYDEQAVLKRARAWKPWRAYAAMYLLCEEHVASNMRLPIGATL